MNAMRWLAIPVLVLLAVPGAAAADPTTPKPKPSSFAPHRTTKHAFGAPIQPQILHKRHKKKPPASKDSDPVPTQASEAPR